MKRLIKSLLALTTISTTSINVLACGMQTKPIVSGKQNVTNEIKVTGQINVTTNNEEEIGESIFDQAIKEKKITQPVNFDMFEITDRENLNLPVKGEIAKGFVVLKVKEDISDFTGVLIIHFNNLQNISKDDISSEVEVPELLDITEFAVRNNEKGLIKQIWGKLPPKTDKGLAIPQDQSDYEISLEKVNSLYFYYWQPINEERNNEVEYKLTARYIGKDNYAGVITFNFKAIYYYANESIIIDYNDNSDELLINRIFRTVKARLESDDGFSINPDDYYINYIGAQLEKDYKKPKHGLDKYVDLLAVPKHPEKHHAIHIQFTATRESVQVKNSTIDLDFTVRANSVLSAEEILNKALENATAEDGKLLTYYGIKASDFDISGWDEIIKQKWPNIFDRDYSSFTLVAKAKNDQISSHLSSNLGINVSLINDYKTIEYTKFTKDQPVIINAYESVDDSFWKIINTILDDVNKNPATYGNIQLSNDIDNLRFKNAEELKLAIADAKNTPGTKIFNLTFAVFVPASEAGSDDKKDVKIEIKKGYFKVE